MYFFLFLEDLNIMNETKLRDEIAKLKERYKKFKSIEPTMNLIVEGRKRGVRTSIQVCGRKVTGEIIQRYENHCVVQFKINDLERAMGTEE